MQPTMPTTLPTNTSNSNKLQATSPSPPTPISEVLPPPHYSYELPSDEEERLSELFEQLDVNGDGRIDIRELSQSLHMHGVPESLKQSYAEVTVNNLILTCLNMILIKLFIAEIYPIIRLEPEW